MHQSWDFVNLYSTTRGTNRFKAILLVCDFLREMPLVQNMGVAVPELSYLREWSETETKLGNPALQTAIDNATGARLEELNQVMAWSLGVNESVAEIVYNLPPFPGVRETLQRLQAKRMSSLFPLRRTKHSNANGMNTKLMPMSPLIAGQEMGTKTEHLTITTKDRYPENHVLMLGDSPGDLKAARDVEALFFPVNPGSEDASWQLFLDEAMDKFFNGQYAGAYEDALIDKFQELLPETPPWQ